MDTNIFLSKKLESVVPKNFIKPTEEESIINNPIGKWNATLFYANRKKCLLLTNSTARYTVILNGFKTADFANLSSIFSEILIIQLLTDKIDIGNLKKSDLISDINLFKTDNDKKIIGTQNYLMENMDYWKKEIGDFRAINKIINEIPYSQLGWLSPNKKMEIIINSIKKDA